ncbi:MAG TPA: hypothetical protein VLL96_02160 [Candidatus Deferrimicrobiaceae bacterium]|nr:hypothetical protein [Candidatus Deferrimicrobiaceae bacterium]
MPTNHYVLTSRLMKHVQKKGGTLCLICHKPIVVGQRVAARKSTAVRHEECYLRSFISI